MPSNRRNVTWFDNKGCFTCVPSWIGCMFLSQMDFINSSVPVKAMNNDIYLYLWRNETVCEIFEASALGHTFFFRGFICKC